MRVSWKVGIAGYGAGSLGPLFRRHFAATAYKPVEIKGQWLNTLNSASRIALLDLVQVQVEIIDDFAGFEGRVVKDEEPKIMGKAVEVRV